MRENGSEWQEEIGAIPEKESDLRGKEIASPASGRVPCSST